MFKGSQSLKNKELKEGIFFIFFELILFSWAGFVMITGTEEKTVKEKINIDSVSYTYELFGEEIYVPEIDRTCVWKTNHYYDYDTGCCFRFNFNDEFSPPDVSYWYVDYYWNSDYTKLNTDFTHVIYNYLEDNWYKEVGDNRWVKISNPPDDYWHTSYDSLVEANLK